MAIDTALLVIAMPVGNVGAAYQREATVARLALLMAEARAVGTPLVLIQHEGDWLRSGVPTWPFLLPLVVDGHTTQGTLTLPAARLIAHHNRTLGQRAPPTPRSPSGHAPRSPADVLKSDRRVVFARCLSLHLPASMLLAFVEGPNTIRGGSL